MQETYSQIHSQSERSSQQLNQAGASAFANLMAALVKLSNREKKNKTKSKKLTVTRTNPSEARSVESATASRTNLPETTMDSGVKVTRKDSDNPDLSPEQQAERSIEQLNSRLANQKSFSREIDVNGTKYKFDKQRNGSISIESKDSRLFAKQGKSPFLFAQSEKLTFTGDKQKIIKDLPNIVALVERELDLEQPKQINNRNEVLYGYDSNNNFIDNKLFQKDAQAVLDLMGSKEGTTIAGGENLLIEYDGKKLFETDAQGVVTHSAYDRDPELLSSIKLKDENGLTELTNYAKRMAATPDREAKGSKVEVSKTNPKAELVPEPLQAATPVAPRSPIGKTLDRAEPTTEVDRTQTSTVVYDQVLKSEFDKVKPKSEKTVNIDGVKFRLNRQTQRGTRSIFVTPNEGSKSIQIGKLDKDGKFQPAPKLNDPNVTKALEKVLVARGIDPQPVKEAQQLEVAARSKDPNYLPIAKENAPSPTPNLSNSPELATAGNAPSINTPKPKPKNKTNAPEQATTTANAQTVTLPTQGENVLNSTPDSSNNSPQFAQGSPERTPAPANAQTVTLPTQGEKGTVTLPTNGGNSERSQPEPEVSPSR
jgi:hypothetical protein